MVDLKLMKMIGATRSYIVTLYDKKIVVEESSRGRAKAKVYKMAKDAGWEPKFTEVRARLGTI